MPSGSAKHPVDFIVVGAGTAGAPLANTLSQDGKTSVLVLEAGDNEGDNPEVIQGAPFGNPDLGGDPAVSFERAATPFEGADAGLFSTGRMWGGSSGQNDLLAVRGTPDVYNQWGLVDNRWNYFNLLPTMRFIETFTPSGPTPNPNERGFSGPLYITQDAQLDMTNPVYVALASGANAPPKADYNESLGDVGTFSTQWFITPAATNQRSFTQTAFLSANVVDANGNGVKGRKLKIQSQSTVVGIIFDVQKGKAPRAIGVRYVTNDNPEKVLEVYAKKKVILAAGTIGSAALLQQSGVGPKALLDSLGIPVIVDNANVGQHVQSLYGPTALLTLGVIPAPVPNQVVQTFADGSGTGLSQPNDGVRRLQLMTVQGSSLLPHAVVTACGGTGENTLSIRAFLLRPNDLGTVQIVSKDPLTQPKIDLGMYQDSGPQSDLNQAVLAYKVIANIAIALNGTMPVYPPNSHYSDDALLAQDAKDAPLLTTFGPTGSCRMAKTANDGVVDGNLDVFGTRGLGIADLSIAPEIPTGTTTEFAAIVIGLQKAKIEGASVSF